MKKLLAKAVIDVMTQSTTISTKRFILPIFSYTYYYIIPITIANYKEEYRVSYVFATLLLIFDYINLNCFLLSAKLCHLIEIRFIKFAQKLL